MNIKDFLAAPPSERMTLRRAAGRRADNALARLRRMSQIEMAEIVRAQYPQAVKIRAAIDEGDGEGSTCGAVGVYARAGQRLALTDYHYEPRADRVLRNLIERAFSDEDGRVHWDRVDDEWTEDYPSGYEDVYEIPLPRLPS